MNYISRLYEKNFSRRLGDWCRNHGVEYIGHVIEDNNAHARLGWGTGHFFRALSGQDMSGIDIVLNQLRPGMDGPDSQYVGGSTDGEFFHYGLGKLGASLGHLTPGHKGRILCEIFGAFGWQLGLKGMKWMLDHMLVRGVNHFVPHAFTAKAFPDPDCPPHFYGYVHNPQFPYFKRLMDYMNRMSHLLNGGIHVATAAVLYHGEAEWGGVGRSGAEWGGDYMLADDAAVEESRLKIHHESFDVLIVPCAEYLPESLLASLEKLARQGLPVIFIDDFPRRSDSQNRYRSWMTSMAGFDHVQTVALENLAGFMKASGYFELNVSDYQPWLRAYHYKRSGDDLYLFFNESPSEEIRSEVSLPQGPAYYSYNAMENRVEELGEGNSGGKISLDLVPGEPILFFTSQADSGIIAKPLAMVDVSSVTEAAELSGPWEISLAERADSDDFTSWKSLDRLEDLGLPGNLPDFAGTIRYRTRFSWEGREPSEKAVLDLGDVFETAEIRLNGAPCGVRIAPPYRFDITGLIGEGENELEILVTTTLVRAQKDRFSLSVAQEPLGLLGPVILI